jgi:hypothetical protein
MLQDFNAAPGFYVEFLGTPVWWWLLNKAGLAIDRPRLPPLNIMAYSFGTLPVASINCV